MANSPHIDSSADNRRAALAAYIKADRGQGGPITLADIEPLIHNARHAAELVQTAHVEMFYNEPSPGDPAAPLRCSPADNETLSYAIMNLEEEIAKLHCAWELAWEAQKASKSSVGA